MSTSSLLHIRDLKHGMKNVNLEFMVLEPSGMNRTKDGDQVWIFKVADSTAAINFAVIGDAGQFLKPGDICKVQNGFCSIFKGALTFYVGKSGTFKRTGEFCFLISEELNMSIFRPPPAANTERPSSAVNKSSNSPSQAKGQPSQTPLTPGQLAGGAPRIPASSSQPQH